MLQTKNLSYQYKGKEKMDFPNIHFAKGEQWLLLGQSGSGKSTLLHLLAGLRKPMQGQVWIDGQQLNKMSDTQLDHFRGKKIGIVFQQSHFVQALTIGENLQLAQSLAGHSKDISRIERLLNNLNISHKINDLPKQLSQGEQQRAAIARALVNRPDIVLADEPTSALDDENCKEVVHLLETQAQEEGATLVIVTHDKRLKDLFPNQIVLT